ncbi:MAG: Alpha-L-arabinofuranosidase precursor [Cytophagaceae bacterium]|jgi:GH43 family beta-xylosidase|nr:Alpha-L-arabinofuranosidase precursor [Cytophagaceae bacterium]
MKQTYRFYLCLLFYVCIFFTSVNAQTFVAPFGSNPDPNIVHHNGWYYYTGTSGNGVYIKKAQTLEGLKHTTMTKVFSSANGGPCCDYWAPEMFRLNNKWYIYYTAKYTGEGQRTYVIENSATDPMSGSWVHKGKIYDSQNDLWAIDGTVLETNGKLYFIWSGVAKATDGDKPQRLYIARMTNAWTLQPGRVLLSSPQLSWEKDGSVNEGPAIIKHNGKIFLTYSANGCWTENYLIATLYMTEGGDPLNAASWKKHDQPLFAKFPGRDVYGPGHHSFFKSPDGKETWFTYHATPDATGDCGGSRTTRAQKVNWDANGFPSLGLADPTGAYLTAPSGEPALPSNALLPNGIYKLKVTSSNKPLDVSGCSAMRGTVVHQWEDNGLDCQKWHLIATPDGYYSINAVKGGLALDVENCSSANGTSVRMWTPSGSDCQKWIIEQVSNGIYRIKSKKSGKVLDIQFGGTNNGAKLQIYDYLGNAQQHFKLERLETNAPTSWESFNFAGHFIRHQNNRASIGKDVSPAEYGQWRMVPGLAGKGISFQSVNVPGNYLRYNKGEAWSQPHNGSATFREEATFYIRPGLADASKVSFESYNHPGQYLRHRNYLLYIESVSAGTGFKDATFSRGSINSTPVVSLTAPANNATYTAPSSISITASASDKDGSISKVEFFRGTTKLGEKTTAPYTYSWTNPVAGTYSITARATDNKGLTNTSAARTITIYSAANKLPAVSLTAPANNATYTAPANITITAAATDSDGSIAKVEFFNGTTKLGEKTASPYSYNWTGVAAGTYSITAKATDDRGGSTASAAVVVKVNAAPNQSPKVSLTSPANNAVYSAPASINITASASDTDGTIAKVEFFHGPTKIGEKTASPYSYTWTGVAVGTYSITAKATDNKGASAVSAARTVVVNKPTTNVCSSLPTYTENGGYTAGSKVKNVNSRYECKPFPYSGWCNGAAWAYAPGTGSYWQDAWTLLGSCTAREENDLASASALISNSPNPFAQSTDLTLQVEQAGDVTVTVFNKTGELVKVINEGYLTEGEHHFLFDASQFPSGMYIVQVKSVAGIVRQKMMKLE